MRMKWTESEELGEDENPVTRLSASAIKTWKWCPEQFNLKYIEGNDSTKIGQGHGNKGNAVHAAIEKVLKQEKSPPRYENQIREAMLSEFRDINPDIDDDMWDDAVDCIDTAATYISDGDLMGREEILGIEKDFDFTLGRSDIQSKFTGIIDLIVDGTIIDWKTGSVREEDEVIQGSVYMRGYQELYGEPPENIIFVYLEDGKERLREPSDDNWNTMIKYAGRVVEDVRKKRFTAKPDPTACFFCDVESFCSESKVGAGGIDWEKWRNRGV